MTRRIEDYAIVGDTETVALIGRDGSVDWWCVPQFDAGACFARLLGDEEHGCFRITPVGGVTDCTRRYRDGTLILETELSGPDGTIRLIDFMPPRGRDGGRDQPDLVRIVEGVRGDVPVRMDLVVRFDYGWVVPWVTRRDQGVDMVAGPDGLLLTTPVQTRGEDLRTVAEFTLSPGDRVPMVVTWHPGAAAPPEPVDAEQALRDTEAWWLDWTGRSTYDGGYADEVARSLITLKALTFRPSGAIVAAPTTSLPEWPGGERNWDYRFTWLRDATLSLLALVGAGYRDEAIEWRDWLVRAVAGDPSRMQILYGIDGERRLPELELDWLPGFENSRPVRVGNGAYNQLQLDVYGEIMDAMDVARSAGLPPDEDAWNLQTVLLDHLEGRWDEPDLGLWESRGDPKKFTHSRVMAWVAFDRAVRAVEDGGLDGPVDKWKRLRDQVHQDVLEHGYDADRGTFTQTYGEPHLDASLLLIPQVGFLPPDDQRVRGTIRAIEEDLVSDGIYVARYDTSSGNDGFDSPEGSFLLCSFWYIDALALTGRTDEAREKFERVLALANDVGLLSEEVDPDSGRLLGNFPQAFSHLGLVGSASNLTGSRIRPAEHRRGGTTPSS